MQVAKLFRKAPCPSGRPTNQRHSFATFAADANALRNHDRLRSMSATAELLVGDLSRLLSFKADSTLRRIVEDAAATLVWSAARGAPSWRAALAPRRSLTCRRRALAAALPAAGVRDASGVWQRDGRAGGPVAQRIVQRRAAAHRRRRRAVHDAGRRAALRRQARRLLQESGARLSRGVAAPPEAVDDQR